MRIGIQLRFIAMGAQSGSRIDPVQQMVIHHHLSRSEPGGRGTVEARATGAGMPSSRCPAHSTIGDTSSVERCGSRRVQADGLIEVLNRLGILAESV